MEYKKTKPYKALQPLVDFYWELKGSHELGRQYERVFPDGCAGIVMNMGDNCLTDNGSLSLQFGKTYVVGAMTTFKDSFIEGGTHLWGVCFKPGAFANFYKYEPQHVLVNDTIEFEKFNSFELDQVLPNPIHYFNRFYSEKIINKANPLQSVISGIHAAYGQIGIADLSKSNFTTIRQLERAFKKYIGMSPKEYANIIRFQHALSMIRNSNGKQNLSDIAFECGYYDQAHLSNDMKKNTGMPPSQI